MSPQAEELAEDAIRCEWLRSVINRLLNGSADGWSTSGLKERYEDMLRDKSPGRPTNSRGRVGEPAAAVARPELRDELARYIAAGRRIGGRKVRLATGQSTTTASDRERNQQIRTWANANGYEVSERGRLSSEVIAAFEQAQIAEAEAPAKAPRKRAPRKKVAAARK